MQPLLRLARKVARQLGFGATWTTDGIGYWEERARIFGRASVLHLGHGDAQYEAVTRWQQEQLFPVLRRQLRGDERTVLDYGCGPGRFTPGLAAMIGRAVGYDPVASLLALAPRAANVDYVQRNGQGQLPLADGSVDVAWICIVLSSVTDEAELERSITEIDRVLAPGGLVFLVENVAPKPDRPTMRFRSQQFYRELFPFAPLEVVHEYEDLGEPIVALAGRKR